MQIEARLIRYPLYTRWTIRQGNKMALVGDGLWGLLINKNGCTSISWLSDRYMKGQPELPYCKKQTITQGCRYEKELTDKVECDKVFAVYRDPVSRFCSYVQNNVRTLRGTHFAEHYELKDADIDRILDCVEYDMCHLPAFAQDRHIRRQVDYNLDLVDEIVKFEHLDVYLVEHGIQPIPPQNSSGNYHIELTPHQEQRLRTLYAADYEILQSPKLWKPCTTSVQ